MVAGARTAGDSSHTVAAKGCAKSQHAERDPLDPKQRTWILRHSPATAACGRSRGHQTSHSVGVSPIETVSGETVTQGVRPRVILRQPTKATIEMANTPTARKAMMSGGEAEREKLVSEASESVGVVDAAEDVPVEDEGVELWV